MVSFHPIAGIICLDNYFIDSEETIVLHIRAQNAAVMIWKASESVLVTVFELSPSNKAAMSTQGRLRRLFPGPAISIDIDTFVLAEFQDQMVQTLTIMSYQAAPGTAAKVLKASQMHEEIRDTVHPKVVTELFMAWLASIGKPIDLPRLWKNTREEILWQKVKIPWRRSPLWLLIRVALQTEFKRHATLSNTKSLYKPFMVYLKSQILMRACKQQIPKMVLFCMNAKIVRRLQKLGTSSYVPGLELIHDVIDATHQMISQEWDGILGRTVDIRKMTRHRHSDFTQALYHHLPALDKYLSTISNRRDQESKTIEQPSSGLVTYSSQTIPCYAHTSNSEYSPYNRMVFEKWVADHLRSWTASHIYDTDCCPLLEELIYKYHRDASAALCNNPEAYGDMILTILELWVASDTAATSICPLLADYDPGIPYQVLTALILPFISQMERLCSIETYLKSRVNCAKYKNGSIFQDYGTSNCFSVNYFKQSGKHQELKTAIEEQASRDRKAKIEELNQKVRDYKSLMRQHQDANCEYYTVIVDWRNQLSEEQHSSHCLKCAYRDRANSLEIQIHEWPLPRSENEAKSVVFELHLPSWFRAWRDTTLFLLLNVIRNKHEIERYPQSSYALRSYQGLASYFKDSGRNQRVCLLSEAKPHIATHRRSKILNNSVESDVCLNNGLRYMYFDLSRNNFLGRLRTTDDVPLACTYELPKASSSLKPYIFQPVATPSRVYPNCIIAGQDSCPQDMSLDEFKGLATIPLGNRVVWLNVLVELSMPSVNLRKAEATIVILQSILRAGPSQEGTVLRQSHEIANDPAFCSKMLTQLQTSTLRIKKNWESCQALSIMIFVAARLLSLMSCPQVKTQYLDYLAITRTIAFEWALLLKAKVQAVPDQTQRDDLTSKAIEIALVCTNTFGVDQEHLIKILESENNASIFIQCCIVVQEGYAHDGKYASPTLRILYSRWQHIAYRAYRVLASDIVDYQKGSLDEAVKQAWSGYESGGRWQRVSDRNSPWLGMQMNAQRESHQLWVHYNLLTGQLLVNGLPLSRLPSEFEVHPVYKRLFGESILDVMPSDILQFSSKALYAGYGLHFAMSPIRNSENDLLIQAKNDHEILMLLPPRLFGDSFPTAFRGQFVQWFNTRKHCVEFRPINSPWTCCSKNWILRRDEGNRRWTLSNDSTSLVSMSTNLADDVTAILSPLETKDEIHIMSARVDDSSPLEIELPKLQLGFSSFLVNHP